MIRLAKNLLFMMFLIASFFTYMAALDASSWAINTYRWFLSLFVDAAWLAYPAWYWCERLPLVYWVFEALFWLSFAVGSWILFIVTLPKVDSVRCVSQALGICAAWAGYVFLPFAEADSEVESFLTLIGYILTILGLAHVLRRLQWFQEVRGRET